MNAPRPPLKALDEALAELLAHAQPLAGIEDITTFDGDGRVLARDITSALHVPPQDNSSMDGYAVRCADLREAKLGPLAIGEGRLLRTDLNRANLRYADLSGANASRARFLEADLSGAKLTGADLRGAELIL